MIGVAKGQWKLDIDRPLEHEKVMVICADGGEWAVTLASFGAGVWRCSNAARELLVVRWMRIPPMPGGLPTPPQRG